MHAIIRAGVLAAAVLWATDSIALEPKRPDSLPALDLSCYIAQSVAFTTLENTGSELGIGGDNYGKPVYRFTTIDGSVLKVVEFPEFDSMRKEYVKTISELKFDNTGSYYIFAWSDNEAMGLRIFVVNQRDRLVSLLEVPPSSQTLPFGTLRVLKCNDTANTAFPQQFTGDGLQKVTAESPSRAITARRPRQTVMGAVPREPRQLGEMEGKSRLAPHSGQSNDRKANAEVGSIGSKQSRRLRAGEIASPSPSAARKLQTEDCCENRREYDAGDKQ